MRRLLVLGLVVLLKSVQRSGSHYSMMLIRLGIGSYDLLDSGERASRLFAIEFEQVSNFLIVGWQGIIVQKKLAFQGRVCIPASTKLPFYGSPKCVVRHHHGHDDWNCDGSVPDMLLTLCGSRIRGSFAQGHVPLRNGVDMLQKRDWGKKRHIEEKRHLR